MVVPANACACATAPVMCYTYTCDMHHLPIFHRIFGILIAWGPFLPFFRPRRVLRVLPPKNKYCVSYARRDTRFFYFHFF
jgi:hypothetical protein